MRAKVRIIQCRPTGTSRNWVVSLSQLLAATYHYDDESMMSASNSALDRCRLLAVSPATSSPP